MYEQLAFSIDRVFCSVRQVEFTDSVPLKKRCQLLGLETPNKHGSCPDEYGMRNDCCEHCTTCPPGQGTSLGVSKLHTVLFQNAN
ncbi:hypothetical protein NP493_243g03088 [Ridgeia piscesae]|uniref:Uncharacterized protein n=1 Tax=Ridgeia piscesae TaxID=27915 RepID=A0AAD9NZ88_RIDPI|nr:hypothetical protein NP493_243g03088 [Ridgeia piscesae]